MLFDEWPGCKVCAGLTRQNGGRKQMQFLQCAMQGVRSQPSLDAITVDGYEVTDYPQLAGRHD